MAPESDAAAIRWKPDGSELYYVNDDVLWAVPVGITPNFRVRGPRREVLSVENTGYQIGVGSGYSVAPDGRFVFRKALPPVEHAVLITGWFEQVERLTGGR